MERYALKVLQLNPFLSPTTKTSPLLLNFINSSIPNCKGREEVKFHFWNNFTIHFTFLDSIYIKV